MRGSEFAELKAFAAVVERASSTRAAGHLGLSPSALSQTIRQLETRLRVRLLHRTTRSVAPTEVGARLYERIAPMIQGLDAAVGEAVASTGRTAGTLRINTIGMAAKKIIAPRLGRFHRAHPEVVLDIVIDDGLTDIVAERFDAGHSRRRTPGEGRDRRAAHARRGSDGGRVTGLPREARQTENSDRPSRPRVHQLAIPGKR